MLIARRRDPPRATRPSSETAAPSGGRGATGKEASRRPSIARAALVVTATWAAAGCSALPAEIEAFDARAAGWSAATGGFTVGVTDAKEGCALVGDNVTVPAGDAHQLVFLVATEDDADVCTPREIPVWPDCGPDRKLDEQTCVFYRAVKDGAVTAEAVAATGTLTTTPGDGLCTFDADVVFPDSQRVLYSFAVRDRGEFPRCEVP